MQFKQLRTDPAGTSPGLWAYCVKVAAGVHCVKFTQFDNPGSRQKTQSRKHMQKTPVNLRSLCITAEIGSNPLRKKFKQNTYSGIARGLCLFLISLHTRVASLKKVTEGQMRCLTFEVTETCLKMSLSFLSIMHRNPNGFKVERVLASCAFVSSGTDGQSRSRWQGVSGSK